MSAPTRDCGQHQSRKSISISIAVRMEAILSAKHIVSAALRTGAPFSEAIQKSFEVTDDTGATVLTMSFAEAVEIDTRA